MYVCWFRIHQFIIIGYFGEFPFDVSHFCVCVFLSNRSDKKEWNIKKTISVDYSPSTSVSHTLHIHLAFAYTFV